MTSDEWHDVLTLMTIVILADRQVYKEDLRAMQHIANSDSDFHKNEESIIARTAKGWGVPYS